MRGKIAVSLLSLLLTTYASIGPGTVPLARQLTTHGPYLRNAQLADPRSRGDNDGKRAFC